MHSLGRGVAARLRRGNRPAADVMRGAMSSPSHSTKPSVTLAVTEYIGKMLGVTPRLHTEFERDSRAHERLLRTQWADRIAWWQRQPRFPPAPTAVPERLGLWEYEQYCAAWLRSRGYLTRASRDGGVDVKRDDVDVQCKHYNTGYVRVQEVREIFGVASHHNKRLRI